MPLSTTFAAVAKRALCPSGIGVTAKWILGAGGGGSDVNGGGAGAGGYIDTYEASPQVISPGVYAVVIGAGGLPFSSGGPTNGGLSSFNGQIAIGGARGTRQQNGLLGGSGSGTCAQGVGLGPYTGGAATASQGHVGGDVGAISGIDYGPGSGGGGANTAGGSRSGADVNGALGGNGKVSSITGASVTRCGGGAGSAAYNAGVDLGNGGVGGLGGGGNGGGLSGPGTDGTANRGAGAGASSPGVATGYRGGSGFFIISYPTGSATCLGGTITTSGGNTIHTFNASGTFTVT